MSLFKITLNDPASDARPIQRISVWKEKNNIVAARDYALELGESLGLGTNYSLILEEEKPTA